MKTKLKEATDRHTNETAKMKGDINGLTEYIATSKEQDGVIDDEYFKAEFGKFAQSMRNWVWKHCRAATLSPDAVEDRMIKEKIKWAMPDFSRLTISHSKIMVMQAVVNDIVLKRIFQRYCVGLSAEDEVSLGTMEQLMMRQVANGGASMSSSPAFIRLVYRKFYMGSYYKRISHRSLEDFLLTKNVLSNSNVQCNKQMASSLSCAPNSS